MEMEYVQTEAVVDQIDLAAAVPKGVAAVAAAAALDIHSDCKSEEEDS